MTRPLYIPTTDPLCQELQRGHDSYYHGLIIADGHTVGADGGFLVDAPEAAKLATGYRRPEETTASVHQVLEPAGGFGLSIRQRRHQGRKVYGIRFWTTTTQQEQS